MSSPREQPSGPSIEELIGKLDSLLDGDHAAARLVGLGGAAIPYVSHYLLSGLPRTVALPRCRAVRVLGSLGAYSALLTYFRELPLPSDPAVLFAEDEVRSTAAEELAHCRDEETFLTLLEATKKRATGGLVHAIGEFQRPEAVPVLFELLEDDLCRDEAKEALLRVPEATHHYGTLLLRGQTVTAIHGPASLRRRRAVLQLLAELDLSPREWKDFQPWLSDQDAEVVITVAAVGLKIAPPAERRQIFEALFRVAKSPNWAQEERITTLLDSDHELASSVGRIIVDQHLANDEHPAWPNPFWRIVRHVLGDALETSRVHER